MKVNTFLSVGALILVAAVAVSFEIAQLAEITSDVKDTAELVDNTVTTVTEMDPIVITDVGDSSSEAVERVTTSISAGIADIKKSLQDND